MNYFEKKTIEIRSNFSANLLTLCEGKKINAFQLCKKINENSGSGSQWKSALSVPSKSAMIKLCNYFKFYDIYSLLTKPIDLNNPNPFKIIPKGDISLCNFSENYKLLLSSLNSNSCEVSSHLFGSRNRYKRSSTTLRWPEGLTMPKWSHFIALCEYFHFYNIYQLITEEIDIGHVVHNWEKRERFNCLVLNK